MRVSIIAGAALMAITGSAFAASTSALGKASISPYASDLGNPPPASAIVTNAGLEWVWASPCGGTPDPNCGGGNPGVLLHDGFGFASAAQWGTWGTLAAFQGAWGGVTCASPQFSIKFDNCDTGDMLAGFIWGSPLTDPVQADNPFSETFLVRAVPEPGTYALMFAGLGLVGWIARRRTQHAA
jgi:hypothetical protein